MRIKYIIILALISVSCFSQKTIPQFKSLNEIQHTTIQKNFTYSFANNLYGGGIFIAEEKGNNIIDSGIVFPTII